MIGEFYNDVNVERIHLCLTNYIGIARSKPTVYDAITLRNDNGTRTWLLRIWYKNNNCSI